MHLLISLEEQHQVPNSPYLTSLPSKHPSYNNFSKSMDKQLGSIGQNFDQQNHSLILSIDNKLDDTIKIIELTGAFKPIHVKPNKSVKKEIEVEQSWPLLIKSFTERQEEPVLLNGRGKVRVYFPRDDGSLKDMQAFMGRKYEGLQNTHANHLYNTMFKGTPAKEEIVNVLDEAQDISLTATGED